MKYKAQSTVWDIEEFFHWLEQNYPDVSLNAVPKSLCNEYQEKVHQNFLDSQKGVSAIIELNVPTADIEGTFIRMSEYEKLKAERDELKKKYLDILYKLHGPKCSYCWYNRQTELAVYHQSGFVDDPYMCEYHAKQNYSENQLNNMPHAFQKIDPEQWLSKSGLLND